MTTDEPALIAAILANRDDDTRRLVYADWLEENEQGERAEFIRVQVAIARGCCGPSCYGPSGMPCEGIRARMECPGCAELRRRERELLYGESGRLPNWGAWSQPIWDTGILIGRPWMERMDYSRGFVSALTCSWSDWSQHADAILRAQPIERVRPTDWLPMQNGYVRLELPDGRIYLNGHQDVRMAHLTLAKTVWPRIEFELPPANDSYAGVVNQAISELVARHSLPGVSITFDNRATT